jgi:hypothetical protein
LPELYSVWSLRAQGCCGECCSCCSREPATAEVVEVEAKEVKLVSTGTAVATTSNTPSNLV